MVFNIGGPIRRLPILNEGYPANVTDAIVGASATFRIEIAEKGVPDSYTYQWYVNGSAVSGATGTTYTMSNIALGTYTVFCTVTNAAGTVQSRTATLAVTTQYLYKNGDPCSGITGGWQDVTKRLNAEASHCDIMRTTVNAVDLTHFSTLHFDGVITDTSGGYPDWVRVCVWSALGEYANQNILAEHLGAANGGFSLDVSSLSGKCIIGYFVYETEYASITMNNLYLKQ